MAALHLKKSYSENKFLKIKIYQFQICNLEHDHGFIIAVDALGSFSSWTRGWARSDAFYEHSLSIHDLAHPQSQPTPWFVFLFFLNCLLNRMLFFLVCRHRTQRSARFVPKTNRMASRKDRPNFFTHRSIGSHYCVLGFDVQLSLLLSRLFL